MSLSWLKDAHDRTLHRAVRRQRHRVGLIHMMSAGCPKCRTASHPAALLRGCRYKPVNVPQRRRDRAGVDQRTILRSPGLICPPNHLLPGIAQHHHDRAEAQNDTIGKNTARTRAPHRRIERRFAFMATTARLLRAQTTLPRAPLIVSSNTDVASIDDRPPSVEMLPGCAAKRSP